MALSSSTYFSSFDISSDTEVRDLSDLMFAALRQDPAILSRIRIGEETSDVTYRWVDDTLNAHQVTVTASAASDATSLALTTNHGNRTREGTLLQSRIRSVADSEILQVTATAASAVTVTRAYGSSTAASIAANAVLDIIGNPLQESSGAQRDVSTTRTARSNVTQIFERTVQVSRNQMLREMQAVNDEFNHQVVQRMFEAKRELNKAVLYGILSADAGSDTSYRSFRGIDRWLSLSGANNTSTAATISEATVNTDAKSVWDDGGDPDLVVVSGDLQQTVSAFESASIRRLESSRVRGFLVDQYVTDLGVPLEIVLDPYVVYSGGRGDYFTLDSSRLSLHPFKNSAFFLLSNPDNTDGRTGRTIGEYTLRVSNPTEAHARRTNVAA